MKIGKITSRRISFENSRTSIFSSLSRLLRVSRTREPSSNFNSFQTNDVPLFNPFFTFLIYAGGIKVKHLS